MSHVLKAYFSLSVLIGFADAYLSCLAVLFNRLKNFAISPISSGTNPCFFIIKVIVSSLKLIPLQFSLPSSSRIYKKSFVVSKSMLFIALIKYSSTKLSSTPSAF